MKQKTRIKYHESLAIIITKERRRVKSFGRPKMQKVEWTFLTNHGHVLRYIARYPQTTTREIARELGITERAVQKIIADLQAAGYVARHKEGRCNRYTVHPELPMRHPAEREYAVGGLLLALGGMLEKGNYRRSESGKAVV